MATKPTVKFTWATTANFSSGAAAGNPTKVNPPGWVTVLEGFVPGDEWTAEPINQVFNTLGDWTGWLDAGSSLGAADAHIVETDANGDTSVVDFTAQGNLTVDNNSIFTGRIDIQDGIGGSFTVGEDDDADFSIERFPRTGTGTDDGRHVIIKGQDGQDQTGGADNNDGGNVVQRPGDPGTGGSGADGHYGAIEQRWGAADGKVLSYYEEFPAFAATASVFTFTPVDGTVEGVWCELLWRRPSSSEHGSRISYAAVNRSSTTVGGTFTDLFLHHSGAGSGPDVQIVDNTDGSYDLRILAGTNTQNIRLYFKRILGPDDS